MTDVLLFDPHAGGHHTEFVRWLVRGWRARGGRLVVAAPSAMGDDPEIARACRGGHAVLAPLPEVARASLRDLRHEERWMFLEVVARHRPRHAVVMYAESLLGALARRVALPPGTRVSGLLFRPTLHYTALGSPPDRIADAARRQAKAAVFALAARHPSVEAVFTLDPEATHALQRAAGSTPVVPLPDPLPAAPPPRAEARARLRAMAGVDGGRQLAVLFGSLDERKGVSVLLDAIEQLPEARAKEMAVLLAGPLAGALASRVHQRAAKLDSGVQLVLLDRRLTDAEADAAVAGADLALLPYQRHVGSSGVLVRAAAAGVPVLAQAWGLVGHQVRTYGLGATVDSASPDALARALARPWPVSTDRREAFLRDRTPERFASIVYDTLLG